jgi:uncharacterized phage infection (PIP) family protein YhgE
MQSFNLSFTLGLRSLRFFADFATDKQAMLSGAEIVIDTLKRTLPQFFSGFEGADSLENALAFVDRGAVAVSSRLAEQETQILELQTSNAALTSEIGELTSTLEFVQSEFDDFKDRAEQLIDSLQASLDTANETISSLNEVVETLKDSLDKANKRLDEAESLLAAWTKAGLSASRTLDAFGVLAYTTAGFLMGGPVGAIAGGFYGEEIVTAAKKFGRYTEQEIVNLGDSVNDIGDSVASVFG